MSEAFFDSPILNSPYANPDRHWQLDENGQPTGLVLHGRRRSDLTTPIPKARTSRGKAQSQAEFFSDDRGDVYDPTEIINGVRQAVASWRELPETQWQVTPTTARLLRHWRSGEMPLPPFFCQIEAVETVIWLTEVAGKPAHKGRKAKLATAQRYWEHVFAANEGKRCLEPTLRD